MELKLPPVLLVALIAASMWLAARFVPALAFASPGRAIISVVLLFLGLVLGAGGVISFRQARTTVDPRKPGEASSLVIVGLYRATRNPMYLGLVCVLLGWALYLSNMVSLALIAAFIAYMNRFQIAPEERALEALFGDEYRAYKRRVRRWI